MWVGASFKGRAELIEKELVSMAAVEGAYMHPREVEVNDFIFIGSRGYTSFVEEKIGGF